MSIGGTTNEQILQSFLQEKILPTANRGNRLYIKNDQLMYDANIGCMALFAAKLGFGNAAMCNVSKFIKKNNTECLKDRNTIADYNAFIASYNDKQCIGWKKAKKIKDIAVKVFIPDPDFSLTKNEDIYKLIKHNLENCNAFALLNAEDLEESFPQFLDACQTLSLSLEEWVTEGKVSKEEKKTLNEILEFKNRARSIAFPANDKPLKGSTANYNPLNNVSKDDKKTLSQLLKNIRTTTLKMYFRERLDLDEKKLVELRMRFDENKGTLAEPQFLEDQLDRWQKKLEQGKPIAIPKWYHCTKQLDTLRTILDTQILYASGCFPGVFVSNRPEVNGVGGYGDYCLVISDHIEKVGTKEPTKGTVYPKYSQMNQTSEYPVRFSDTPLAPQDNAMKDNQEGVGIWFGFQRGAVHGFDPHTKLGKSGVPLERMNRIKNGSLKYYKDTTLAYVFDIHNSDATKKMAPKRRVQVVTYKQAEAMRTLINSTFHCTLPSDWEGKLTSFKSF